MGKWMGVRTRVILAAKYETRKMNVLQAISSVEGVPTCTGCRILYISCACTESVK